MARIFLPLSSLLSPRALAVVLALCAAACTPKIGDTCVLSTDCSTQGSRQCDTSMPGGYCTVVNCGPNGCPDYAACILFHPAVQGCEYNDRVTSRTSQSYCMAGCNQNSDCRFDYICVDPRQAPWNALNLDDNQGQKVCVPTNDSSFNIAYSTESDPDAQAPVCQAYPDVDAAFPAEDAASPPPPDDAGPGDAATEGGRDAGVDATE